MIRTEHLQYSYRTDQTPVRFVLDDVNLEIKTGEFVAVLGHNGCGKSTLAKQFNGLLLPTGGRVYVAGMDTQDEELYWNVRQSVGMVFQNPDNQLVATVVEEDVAFAPENLGVPSEEIRRRVDDALKAVGMYEFRRHAPHRLSGGQKQRVAIAGAIAMRPKCIVLDEPTAMLDPQGRREVLATIRRLKEEDGMTVVLITHYMDEAAKADRVIVLDKGSVLLDDVPRRVFSEVRLLEKIGLDVPQVTKLLYELKKAGYPLEYDILTVEGCADELMKILA